MDKKEDNPLSRLSASHEVGQQRASRETKADEASQMEGQYVGRQGSGVGKKKKRMGVGGEAVIAGSKPGGPSSEVNALAPVPNVERLWTDEDEWIQASPSATRMMQLLIDRTNELNERLGRLERRQ